MNNNGEKKNISRDTLEKIKNRRVKMRGKWYFVLKALLWVAAGIALFALVSYLATFILFSLKISGLWYVPNFGVKGLLLLIGGMPWVLVLFVLLLTFAIEALLKSKTSMYREPLLYSAIVIIILLFVLGAGFYRISVHQRIAGHLQEARFSALRPLYQKYGAVSDRIYFGRVASIGEDFITIISSRDKQLRTFKIDSRTKRPLKPPLRRGNGVIILSGGRADGILRAEGIRHMRAMRDMMGGRMYYNMMKQGADERD